MEISSDSSVAAMEMAEEGQNQPKIPPKLKKSVEIVEKWGKDRLSALPDCLLLEILSRLPCTKGAIATGILSKRWEHLWTLLPTLVFYHDDDDHPWSDFVSFLDKTLAQCRQLKLKKFKLYTSSYDVGSDSQVNNWIDYAIRCNVEELILILFNMYSEDEQLSLDQSFFISSCFTDLNLDGCILKPTGAISWKNLRNLCITNGKLDEDLIENILSGSPLLETLVLNGCCGYSLLNITSKSVKNLVFGGYSISNDESDTCILKVNAPNILSLAIQDDLVWLRPLLVNVSSLVEANLNYSMEDDWETTREEGEEEMLVELILKLSHVKELKIGGLCSEVMSRLEAQGFVIPSNMKFTGVTYDW